MQITFLKSADDTPIAKRFSIENGILQKHSYPHVLNFTSETYTLTSMKEFYERTLFHAERGHCLLKGEIKKALNKESRAGSTSATDQTQWILFDLDGVTGFNSIEEFIAQALPNAFHNASYIVHHSASAGIVHKAGLNCHLAFFINHPMPAPALKVFLEHLNYQNDTLRGQLALTASGATLRYALDITTCQNDKLIFIAPPTLGEGVVDSLTHDRIQLIEKSTEFVQLTLPSLNPETMRSRKDEIVQQLRTAAGLPKKTITYKTSDNVHYIANPDQATITGLRQARGFVYLNLDGGDSWAYYFPEDNPTYLYSFKEPGVAYRLKDINPEFASSFAKEREASDSGKSLLYFRDIISDTYWNGFYDTDTGAHQIYKTNSKEKIKDFCKNNGVQPPKTIPDWRITFDPRKDKTVDFENKHLNRFVPSTYLLNPNKSCSVLPPISARIIHHVLGNDDETVEHFLNWLAHAYQKRTKIGTAWILTGTEGTGKGLLFSEIITPLFGADYCVQKGLANLEDGFNDWEESTIFLNFNEAHISADSAKTSKVMNKLKMMVTEPTVSIRAMRTNQYTAPSFINLIITSNHQDAITITSEDRRFNVAPRQDTKIRISEREVDSIVNELPQIAGFLANYAVDDHKARTVQLTEAKENMIDATLNSADQFFHAVQKGDLEYFAQYLSVVKPQENYTQYMEFEETVIRWLRSVGKDCRVLREDLMIVYTYLQAKNPPKPNQFARLLAHKNIHMARMRIDDHIYYGRTVAWQCDQAIVDSWTKPRKVEVA